MLCAGQRSLITYGELQFQFYKDRNTIGFYAGVLGFVCEDLEWPLLNSLIVSKTTGQSSRGFDPFTKRSEQSWGDNVIDCYNKFKDFNPNKDKKFIKEITDELLYWDGYSFEDIMEVSAQ